MANEKDREPSFKVQDRRRFSSTGEAREDVADERTDETPRADSSRPAAAQGGEAAKAGTDAPHIVRPGSSEAGHAQHDHAHDHDHPHDHAHDHDHDHHDHEHGHEHGHETGEITFASFVFSLSTQALIHLGEVPDPIDGSTHVNLEAARQIIDIIAILRDKTRGNLDQAENSLLESALYDLRMRFVERARNP